MVKTLQKSSPEPMDRFPRNRLVSSWGLQPIIVCSNDEPGLTLNYFTARSNLVTFFAFLLEKLKTVDFSETIEACDLKVGRCSQLIELMKVQKVKVIF